MNLIEKQLNEKKPTAALFYSQSLIEANLNLFARMSSKGKMTAHNTATEKMTRYCRSELIDSSFSNYFTKSEKTHQTYKKAHYKALITNSILTIRHRESRFMNEPSNTNLYRNHAGELAGVL